MFYFGFLALNQVDHSIVESFAQGGRTVITSRVYPTEAIYGAARLFLFNNATGVNVKATLKIWQLNSAFIHPFPLDQIDTVKPLQPVWTYSIKFFHCPILVAKNVKSCNTAIRWVLVYVILFFGWFASLYFVAYDAMFWN